MIEAGIITLLEATTAITDLVGVRIYGIQLPQDPTMPAVVVTNITGQDDYEASGALDLIIARFQIDCYGATLAESLAIGIAINDLMSGYKGAAGDETILGSFNRNKRDLYDSETKNHRRLTEYEIFYKE